MTNLPFSNLCPGNYYKIYPHPPEGTACDASFWLLLWIKWLEITHLGHPMEPMDYVFPAMGASGLLQPVSQLTHDTVQKWLDESAGAVSISVRLTTHCFQHGWVQYRLLYVPFGQWWSLQVVQWWDDWAEGEQVSIMQWDNYPVMFFLPISASAHQTYPTPFFFPSLHTSIFPSLGVGLAHRVGPSCATPSTSSSATKRTTVMHLHRARERPTRLLQEKQH